MFLILRVHIFFLKIDTKELLKLECQQVKLLSGKVFGLADTNLCVLDWDQGIVTSYGASACVPLGETVGWEGFLCRRYIFLSTRLEPRYISSYEALA